MTCKGANGMAEEKPKYKTFQNAAFMLRRYWQDNPRAVSFGISLVYAAIAAFVGIAGRR